MTAAPTDPATAPTTTPAATPARPRPRRRPAAGRAAADVAPADHAGTTAQAPAPSGTALVQAGAYGTRAAAADAVAKLAAKGFGGFEVSGDGPFRVVRRGLSSSAAAKLVQALAAAGITAYVRT